MATRKIALATTFTCGGTRDARDAPDEDRERLVALPALK